MSKHTSITIVALCLIAGADTASAQEPPQNVAADTVPALRANPFSRPGYTMALDQAPLPAAVVQPLALDLRATLVAGDTALVNINGRILSIGEEYEGYRVLSIGEGRAVLSNSGERLVLDVYEKQLGLDENDGIGPQR